MVVKTIKDNNAVINIHDDYIPKDLDKYKENLKRFYTTMNIVTRDFPQEKIDELFYSKSELEDLKKDKNYQFI